PPAQQRHPGLCARGLIHVCTAGHQGVVPSLEARPQAPTTHHLGESDMADKYQELVTGGPLTGVAKSLGLPQPPHLRRHKPGDPLLKNDKVLVTGSGSDADAVAKQLGDWDLNVRRDQAGDDKVGAIVVVVTEAARPKDLQEPVLNAAKHLRKLDKGGRFIVISRAKAEHGEGSGSAEDVAVNAARGGAEGLVRSMG